MTRLRFSRSIRRAEVARSRTSIDGDFSTCCRQHHVLLASTEVYNSKTAPAKRRLALRRWHGPGLVVAQYGVNVFISHKGQLTKCPLEHVRLASTLEQIAATTWQDAMEESVEHALHDMAAQGDPLRLEDKAEDKDTEAGGVGVPVGGVGTSANGADLPAVAPAEMVAAMDGGGGSLGVSACECCVGGEGGVSRAQPGSPVPDMIRRSSQAATPSALQPALDRLQQLQASGSSEAESSVKAWQRFQLRQTAETDGPTMETEEPGMTVVETHELFGASPIPTTSQAMLDRQDPEACRVEDHGSSDGRWELPSACDWKARSVWIEGRLVARSLRFRRCKQLARSTAGSL